MKEVNIREHLPQGFPVITTLCGSSRFKNEFIEVQKTLGLKGEIVLTVSTLESEDNAKMTPKEKERVDNLHLKRIDLADGIFIIDVNGYMGESTKKELTYALKKGKKVRYYSEEFEK